ncbi:hypothetical protein NDU88_000264 [Pleurodeles waltl]|uniref:Uncharacterized protein n=1 Tax=Pleurodeles waltl TaxID=8319 RepID=A0AAV7MGX8_PLEWA|nr:hypothetical protein NDU88_000264 [Pleurodeles waltl]
MFYMIASRLQWAGIRESSLSLDPGPRLGWKDFYRNHHLTQFCFCYIRVAKSKHLNRRRNEEQIFYTVSVSLRASETGTRRGSDQDEATLCAHSLESAQMVVNVNTAPCSLPYEQDRHCTHYKCTAVRPTRTRTAALSVSGRPFQAPLRFPPQDSV